MGPKEASAVPVGGRRHSSQSTCTMGGMLSASPFLKAATITYESSPPSPIGILPQLKGLRPPGTHFGCHGSHYWRHSTSTRSQSKAATHITRASGDVSIWAPSAVHRVHASAEANQACNFSRKNGRDGEVDGGRVVCGGGTCHSAHTYTFRLGPHLLTLVGREPRPATVGLPPPSTSWTAGPKGLARAAAPMNPGGGAGACYVRRRRRRGQKE